MRIRRDGPRFMVAGWQCGLRGVLRARSRETLWLAARLALCPVDLWRWVEYGAVLDAHSGESVALDLASPKLLSALLHRQGCRVIATDIIARLRSEMPLYQRKVRVAGVQCDAAALPLPDACLPFAYSVSAVEHMGAGNDACALGELRRVLLPGGRAVVTAPVGPQYAEHWHAADPYGKQARDAEGRVFFGCTYDRTALYSRVIDPAGMRVVSLQVWQEWPPAWYLKTYLGRTRDAGPIRMAAGKLLDPFWAARHIHAVPEGLDALEGYGVASIVFAKD